MSIRGSLLDLPSNYLIRVDDVPMDNDSHRLATRIDPQPSGSSGSLQPWFEKNLKRTKAETRGPLGQNKLDDVALRPFRTNISKHPCGELLTTLWCTEGHGHLLIVKGTDGTKPNMALSELQTFDLNSTGLFKTIDSLTPFDERLATFRGNEYLRKGQKQSQHDKTEHGNGGLGPATLSSLSPQGLHVSPKGPYDTKNIISLKPQFPVNYPPQETSREILQAQEDLMEAIQAFLKEYDHIPPNEKCMALLLAEERFLKIKQAMEEEQNQPEVLQELLLKLINDLQILKGIQQEKKKPTAQSSIPYWNSSMIDDEEARDNFLKDVCTFLRKFSRIPFGVTPKVILIAWESFGEIKDALMDKQYRQEDIQELMSKLLEDVRNISEEFSEYINCPSWNRPLFYFDDDDDEYTVIWRRPKVITPDEPSEEPEDPLIMGEKELSTIPEKDKSSVEDLVQIPSGSKGVSDDICDNDHSDAESLLRQNIPITSPKINFLSEEFTGEFTSIPPGMDEDEFDEEVVNCYDHDISSDDDSYKNIEYVEASPLNLEYDSLEEENEDQEEKEFDLEDIFQIQDVILCEKLLNVHRLIANIEYLKDNPTPDYMLKSPISVTDSHSFFEKSNTFFSFSDNFLPEFETFSDHTEETRSGSTTTHANNSLPEYDSFLFEIELDQGGLTSVVISNNLNDPLLELPEFESFHFDLDPSFPRLPPEPPDAEISLIIEIDAPVINNFDELNEDECFDPGGGEINVEVDNSFTFVTWIFLPFLTYPEVSPLLSSTRNEDTIYDPGIST
ncbi:hypothetical protein Tco_0281636 [Tanacetum coccineum]